MQAKILVTYATNAGSTADVARAIGEALAGADTRVDVRRIADVRDLDGYTAVVVGGPMIMGLHREVVAFLARHQDALDRVPVAYFITAMSLTRIDAAIPGVLQLFMDPGLAKAPLHAEKLSFRESYATPAHYLQPALARAPRVKPIGVAFFGGTLDPGKLGLLQRLFVSLVVGAQPGDLRNWAAIHDWAAGLRGQLVGIDEWAARPVVAYASALG